ncbi:hypothetical protein ACFL35_01790 [Candidatus Riflebacteria bacterium]
MYKESNNKLIGFDFEKMSFCFLFPASFDAEGVNFFANNRMRFIDRNYNQLLFASDLDDDEDDTWDDEEEMDDWGEEEDDLDDDDTWDDDWEDDEEDDWGDDDWDLDEDDFDEEDE